MKKLPVFLLAGLILTILTLSLATTVSAVGGEARPALQQASTLPSITFLGEGPGTFTVEPPLKLLVKTYQNGQFLFVEHEELSYTAAEDERVWTINYLPAEPIRLFHEWRNYGSVPAGCVVNFVQIEDNIDNRRNTFYINGKSLHVVEQGWVTYGSFTIPEDGELTFYAEDSIGMVIELCNNLKTPLPPAVTATATATETATATATFTVTATATATATATVPTAIVELPTATTTPTTGSSVPTATASATATTGSSVPTATATTRVVTVLPPAATATATRAAALIQITATPLGTPAAIPVTGGLAGPREITAVSLGIVVVGGLLAAAWWFALRAYRHGR